MTDATRLIETLGINQWVIQAQTEGLSHADSLPQLPFRGNCLNWVVGHIAVHRDKMLDTLGQPPTLGEAEMALYNRGSEPITGGSPAVSLEELLAAVEQAQERLVASLGNATPELLAAVIDPERGRTVADRVRFLLWHETYHAGQLEYLRQLAGMDDAVIE